MTNVVKIFRTTLSVEPNSRLFDAKDETEILKALERGADINGRNADGDTKLIIEVKAGNADNVKLLLLRGADIYATDRFGLTAPDYTDSLLRCYKEIGTIIRKHDRTKRY